MKLTSDSNNNLDEDVDVLELLEELKANNHSVYWCHISNQIYIYKPLGRRDHKDIIENEELNTMEKEDEVIRKCLLYPYEKDFDLDNTEAGIIDKLLKTIIENSFLKSIEVRTQVMEYFRSEMFDLQEQITCIINEAFPQFDIEEIENWGIERTAKYLSRAEWKLQNFRGAVFNHDVIEDMQQKQDDQSNIKSDDVKNTTSNDSKKERMTPEKLAEMKRRFPEINWDADVIANEGINGMKDNVDSTSVALRVGGN